MSKHSRSWYLRKGTSLRAVRRGSFLSHTKTDWGINRSKGLFKVIQEDCSRRKIWPPANSHHYSCFHRRENCTMGHVLKCLSFKLKCTTLKNNRKIWITPLKLETKAVTSSGSELGCNSPEVLLCRAAVGTAVTLCAQYISLMRVSLCSLQWANSAPRVARDGISGNRSLVQGTPRHVLHFKPGEKQHNISTK